MIPRLTDTPGPAPLQWRSWPSCGHAASRATCPRPTPTGRCWPPTTRSTSSCRRRSPSRATRTISSASRACWQDPRFAGVTLAPRGGGTGTNGQSLTDGLVVDVSRHMNRILEINAAERWVRVEAGRGEGPAQRGAGHARPVLRAGALDLQPRHHRRDDQHRRLRPGLLPLRQDARPRAGADHRAARRHGLALDAAGRTRSWPRCSGGPTGSARSTGWSTAIAARQRGADRPALPEAQPLPDRLRPRPYPRRARPLRSQRDPLRLRGHARLHRRGEAERPADSQAQRAGQRALRQLRRGAARRPGADRLRRGLDRDGGFQGAGAGPEDIIWEDVREFFPEDDGQPAARRQPGRVRRRHRGARSRRRCGGSPTRCDGGDQRAGRGFTVARGETDVERIWEMRKKAVGLLGNMQGDKRPIAFVEDTAVPPENLADYIAEFRARCSTGAGSSTACSATSMPACCMSARPST